ncbi:MAG: septal ring lytic transglycosylase RlpA family protein [Acidobacteria bacterium]|nr:septal ring lytic transglycosylase RlpA family protein [Acidobacteriota bacterium]
MGRCFVPPPHNFGTWTLSKRKLAILLIVLLLTACGKKGRVSAPSTTLSGKVQKGLASFYGQGDGYHGRTTASGERFDKNKLTAAHYSLPFGTRVRVRNLKTDKKVVVRINDRLPLETTRKGRIIDLSYAAAKALRMVREGVVPVIVEILSMPSD